MDDFVVVKVLASTDDLFHEVTCLRFCHSLPSLVQFHQGLETQGKWSQYINDLIFSLEITYAGIKISYLLHGTDTVIVVNGVSLREKSITMKSIHIHYQLYFSLKKNDLRNVVPLNHCQYTEVL